MYQLKKSNFLILIPAYNELNNLKKFIRQVNELAPLIVLDDCSTDGTQEWLITNNIKFLRNNTNLGYEKNLLRGIKEYKDHCNFLITFDGDGQHKVSDLKKIINVNFEYDVIICSRKNKNRLFEIFISLITKFLFGFDDPLSGFKVYRTKILSEDKFNGIGDFFLVDFLLKLSSKRQKIINLSIDVNKRYDLPRVGGVTKLFFKEIKILFKILMIRINN